MLLRKAEIFPRGIDKFCARFAMGFRRSLNLRNPFPCDGVNDEELRFPVLALFRDVTGIEEFLHVVDLDFLRIESVGLITFSRVFTLRLLGHGIERDGVRIVNQNQIIETEMGRERACFRGHAFLETTITRQTKNMLIENAMVAGVEMRGRHFCRHCHTNRVANALPQRASRTLDSRRFKKFWMSRRFRMQLTKIFDVLDRNVVPAQVQPGIQKHAAVSGGKNEIVAIDPAGLIWIVSEQIPVEYRSDLGASEGQAVLACLRRLA